jgi:hypothetical protein
VAWPASGKVTVSPMNPAAIPAAVSTVSKSAHTAIADRFIPTAVQAARHRFHHPRRAVEQQRQGEGSPGKDEGRHSSERTIAVRRLVRSATHGMYFKA